MRTKDKLSGLRYIVAPLHLVNSQLRDRIFSDEVLPDVIIESSFEPPDELA
jgi:hypothetical protein